MNNNTQVITTSNVNVLAATSVIATAASIVSLIFTLYYSSVVMSFTQEFTAFGLSW